MQMQKTAGDAMHPGVLSDLARRDNAKGPAEDAIAIYENQVPAFVEAELERLYGTLFSTLAYFRACGGLDGVKTYVARRNGVVSAVFLFRREGERVQMINEGMVLDADEIRRFAQHMFHAPDPAGVIVFHAVQTASTLDGYLHQRYFCAEDFIVELPDTPEAYLARLGSATRKNIKRHKNRIERDFPSFQHRMVDGRTVDEQHVRTIIELNRARMAGKNKASFIDESVTQEILRLTRECGVVYLATIDGRVCAGTIIFRVGSSYISKVNAHDPRYDDYRLGMVCCYLGVCAAIGEGARRFHFGQGRYEYKVALLGEHHGFDRIVLYRSPLHLLLNAKTAYSSAAAGYRLRANRWFLHGTAHGTSLFWRAAARGLDMWRARKRTQKTA